MKKLALAFSAIFHPLLMTTLLIASLFWLAPNVIGQPYIKSQWILIGLFGLLTFALPLLSILLLKLTSNITSMHMTDRKERILPLLFTCIYYGFSIYLVAFQYRLSEVIVSLMTGVFITLILCTIITIVWKISIHSAGAWGGVGMFIALYTSNADEGLFILLLISILLAGTISSARMYLGAHNLSQTLAGAIVGFLSCFTPIFLIL